MYFTERSKTCKIFEKHISQVFYIQLIPIQFHKRVMVGRTIPADVIDILIQLILNYVIHIPSIMKSKVLSSWTRKILEEKRTEQDIFWNTSLGIVYTHNYSKIPQFSSYVSLNMYKGIVGEETFHMAREACQSYW